MKKVLSAFGLAIALAAAHPAVAFDSPLTDQAAKERVGVVGGAYQRYATAFGYTDLAWGNATGGSYSLKYVKHGDTMATAKSMVSISVSSLSGDKDKDDVLMNGMIKALEAQYTKSATVLDDKILKNPLDEKTLFLQYYYGSSPNMTYVTAVYMRTNTKPSQAALIQLISRSVLPRETVFQMLQFVDPQAVMPVKKKKAFDPLAPIGPEPESITK